MHAPGQRSKHCAVALCLVIVRSKAALLAGLANWSTRLQLYHSANPCRQAAFYRYFSLLIFLIPLAMTALISRVQ